MEKAKNAFNNGKGNVEDILEKAKAEAKTFLDGVSDFDFQAKFSGAMEKAKAKIEKAKNLTPEEKQQALEKGKAFF